MHLSLAAVIAASSAATAYASRSKSGKQTKTQSFSKVAKSAYSTSMSMSVGPNPSDEQGDAFDCTSTTIFLDLANIVKKADYTLGGVGTTYTTFDAYTSNSLSGSPDGRFSFKRVEDDFSCQGSAMLGLDGSSGSSKNQIYVSTVCDPDVKNPTFDGYITPGGITAGFGDFAGATGIMEYDVSGDVGEVKFYICLPVGLKWEE